MIQCGEAIAWLVMNALRSANTIDEVQEFATRWLWNHNHERPSMGLDELTLMHSQLRSVSQSLPTVKTWNTKNLLRSHGRNYTCQ